MDNLRVPNLRADWNEAGNGWCWKFMIYFKNKYCTIVCGVIIIIGYHATCSQNANLCKLLI